MSVVPFSKGLSTPGCWAYPDMLEVGCSHGPGGDNDPGLSYIEARTHFGAWCIVSSPLILSHDTNNDTITDEVWDIISNKEAIAINQAYDGDSGALFAESSDTIVLNSVPSLRQASLALPTSKVGVWQQWSKKIDATTAAVLIMNNDESSHTITLDLHAIPTFNSLDSSTGTGTTYQVRDVWSHTDKGKFSDTVEVVLDSHDSAFFLIKV